jgi:protein involved in polysaccharide export with SLBB domain
MTKPMLTRGIIGLAAIIAVALGISTQTQAVDYVVRPDDRLRIKIFQFPELSADYTVSSSGTVLIPPIGEIPVAGSSVNDISNDISKRFIKSGISDKPGATVEVIQSRPVYVVGDVQKAGEYSYRAGMTVLQAISLAGGWFRVNDPGLMRLDREAITIRGDMRNLVRRYYQLMAQRARLNAELASKIDVDFPADLKKKAEKDASIAELLDEERSFLSINVNALSKHLDNLEKTRGLFENEIEAVLRQIEASKIQARSVREERKEMDALFARGLGTITRKSNLERLEAQVEMTEQGYQTLLLRARQSISLVDQKIFDIKNERNTKLNEELQRTRLELEQVAMRIDTSQNLLGEIRSVGPILVGNSSNLIEGRILTIVRMQDEKIVTIEADETTELVPGDVLKVEKSIIPLDIPDLNRKVIRSSADRN